MSKRFFILLVFLAALTTAATYWYTADTREMVSDPGLRDLERLATVHGWPWGYHAEVTELVRLGENRVIVIEYNELRFEMLVQTYMVWFVAWMLVIVSGLILFTSKLGGG